MARMKRKKIVFDFGNSRGKAHNPDAPAPKKLDDDPPQFYDFRHAIAALSDNDWRNIVGRGKPPHGIVRINGIPYAFGDAARRHIIKERPKGAARYREDYYGVALAYAMSETLRESSAGVSLYASYPPGDVSYARNIELASKRQWHVESRHGNLDFAVDDVGVFDEPLGGYSHFVLNKNGTEQKNNPLADKTTLVVDAGGYTVDVVPIDPGGQIDYLGAKSTRVGGLSMIDQFESELRGNHINLFQDTGEIDIRRIEKALLEKVYRFGKIDIDCEREANAAIRSLTNDVVQVIGAAGGVANFDVILVTGGFGALLFDSLCEALPRADFWMAENDRQKMMFANVMGGAKLFKMLQVMGMI